MSRKRMCGLIVAAALVVSPAAAQAETIPVTLATDTVADDGKCSLREAVTAANTDTPSGAAAGECFAGSGADEILLGLQTFARSRAGSDDTNVDGDLDLTGTVTIRGSIDFGSVIDANGIDRVIDVRPGAIVTIQDVTVREGVGGPGGPGGTAVAGPGGAGPNVPGGAGGNGGAGGTAFGGSGIASASHGGGIRNAGTLTVVRSTITGNRAGAGGAGGDATGGAGGAGGSGATGGSAGNSGNATGGSGASGADGGGIANTGTLEVVDSKITGNDAGQGGDGGDAMTSAGGAGGAGTGSGGSGGNGGDATGGAAGAGGRGGGIVTSGPLTVVRTAITNNAAGTGGASGLTTAGAGGDGGSAGPGATGGTGGTGGDETAQASGTGGAGGGVGASGSPEQAYENVTLAGNAAGDGGGSVSANGGTGGNGGNAGAGGTPGSGGIGGSASASFPGGGGNAGGAIIASADFTHATVAANTAGAQVGGASATPGSGGSNGTVAGARFAAATSVFDSRGADGRSIVRRGGPTPGTGGLAGTATLRNTIVAGNAGTQCSGTLTDDGGNVSYPDGSCAGTTVNPQLQPLADNGGTSETVRLGAGSSAIDLVPAAGNGCTVLDQRGLPRPSGAGCDAGAYEVMPPVITTEAAERVTSTGAYISATLDPRQRSAFVRFEVGTTAALGDESPAVELGPGLVEGRLGGLEPDTTYHYRFVAITVDGEANGATRTFRTAVAPPVVVRPDGTTTTTPLAATTPAAVAPPVLSPPAGTPVAPGARDLVAPRVTRLTMTRAFRAATRGGSLARAAAVRTGSAVSFRSGEAGTAVFSIRRQRGRRSVAVRGSFRRAVRAGRTRLRFTGRVRGRKLPVGSYRLVLVVTDAAGNRSVPRGIRFRIVR